MTVLLWILGIALYLFIGGMVAAVIGNEKDTVWNAVLWPFVPILVCLGVVVGIPIYCGTMLVNHLRRPHD